MILQNIEKQFFQSGLLVVEDESASSIQIFEGLSPILRIICSLGIGEFLFTTFREIYWLAKEDLSPWELKICFSQLQDEGTFSQGAKSYGKLASPRWIEINREKILKKSPMVSRPNQIVQKCSWKVKVMSWIRKSAPSFW